MKKILLLISCLTASQLMAQSSYMVSYSANTGTNPGNLNTETDATSTGWVAIVTGPQAANIWSPSTAIPFPFEFFGNPVTSFRASQNGVVSFATNPVIPSSTNGVLPDATLPDSSICGFWDSFTATSPTGSGDNIYTNVFGAAPNRQLWIKWYSFEMGNPTVSFLYFSIVLEETTNKIYVVDQYSSTTPLLTSTVGVQFNSVQAVQYGLDNLIPQSGNGTAITDNDYYEFTPILVSNNNASIGAFASPPTPFTPGAYNVEVIIDNNGGNFLTSATIDWEVNGIAQTPFSWTGAIAPFTSSAPVFIGAFTFPAGSTTLTAWTSNPNGVADSDPSDDTLSIVTCSGLSGAYDIGGATPDFADMDAALTALMSCGVTGPTTFNCAPGTYNGSYVIGEIPGASETDSVVFDGSGSATLAATADAIIHLQGTGYVTFRNFIMTHSGITNAWAVRLSDSAHHCVIDNCVIEMNPVVGNANVIAILGSASNTDDFAEGDNCNYCTFSNNMITGGEMAFHFEGSDAIGVPGWMRGISIINNTISEVDDYGVYVDNLDSLIIRGNHFSNFNETVNADGLYLLDIMNMEISYNVIFTPDWGIYILDGNFDAVASGQSSIRNNMVKSVTDYAAYFDGINQIDIFHNTFYGNPGIRINDVTTSNLRNNIFTSDLDFAFESDDAANIGSLDYNLYWTPPSNPNFAKFGASTYANLTLFQAAVAAANANSIQVEPHFAGAMDLHRIGNNGNDLGDNTAAVSDDIDGDARPLSPSVVVDMGADEFTPNNFDAIFVDVISPNNWACGDSILPIEIVLGNFADTIFTMPVTINVSGAVNQTFNYTYNGTLGFVQFDTVVIGTINAYAGGTITITGWTSLAGEQETSNDTLDPVTINIIPFEPVGYDTIVCGPTAILNAEMGYPVTYNWYDAPVGGNLVGTGNSFTVPSVGTQGTYYLEYSGSIDSMTTTMAGGNSCGGGAMFDITSISGTIISGFDVSTTTAAGTPFTVTVHYIANGTYLGNETNAAAWTTTSTYNVISAGTGNPSSFDLTTPIPLPAGVTYAIYLEYAASYTNGTSAFTSANGDITLQTGAGLCSAFGGVNAGRMFNGEVRFESTACSNVRTPVTAANFPVPSSSFTLTNTGPTYTFTNTATNENSILFLFGDGNQSTNNTPVYTYSTGGPYTVCMVAYGTCENDTACQNIVAPWLGVNEQNSSIGLQVIPNPTDGLFNLVMQTATAGEYTVKIFSALGQQLFTESFAAGTGSTTRNYDLSAFTPGSYFIRIESEKEHAVQRLIIK